MRADEQTSLFPESTKNLLRWRDEGFPEGGLGTSGETEMRSTFRSQGGSEDGPKQLGNIVRFATDKMDLSGKERASIRKLIDPETGRITVIPQGKKLSPAEVLRDILRGKYDEEIRSLPEIKKLPDAYVFALYSLKETLCDSRERISEVLGEFLVNYDVPESHIYLNEYPQVPDYEGLEAEMFLRDLCRTVIKEFDISRKTLRESFWGAYTERKRDLDNQPSKHALDNLDSVLFYDDDSVAKLSTDGAHSSGNSVQSPVIESIPPETA